MSGYYGDDSRDTESEFREDFHKAIPRELKFGVPLGRDIFGRFSRQNRQVE